MIHLKQIFSATLLICLTASSVLADIPTRPRPPKPVVKRFKVEHRVYRIDESQYADFDLCLFVIASSGNDTLAGYNWSTGDTLTIGRKGEKFVVTAAKGASRFQSEAWQGDVEEVTDKKVACRLHHASIQSIQDGKVEVEVDSGELLDAQGNLLPSKGGLEGFGWFQSLGLPIICLLGLGLFFLLRRKQSVA